MLPSSIGPPCWCSRLLAWLAMTAALALPGTCALASAEGAGSDAPLDVLVFEGEDLLRPAYLQFAEAFRSTLLGESPLRSVVYFEPLDLVRFRQPAYVDGMREWHRRKYAGRRIGVIVAIGPPALGYAGAWRDSYAPDVPIVFANVSRRMLDQMVMPALTTGLLSGGDITESMRIGLELFPQTRRVAIVGGERARDPFTNEFAEAVAAALGTRVELIDLTGLPMPELLERVGELPADTIVGYAQVGSDSTGRAFVPVEVLELLSARSSRPVFSFIGTYLGRGTIGGMLLSPTVIGQESARLAARILRGESPAAIPARTIPDFQLSFDARQLQRFGVSESALPEGSRVINREPSLWDEHRGEVITAVVALLLQALLIGALLRERRARRRVNVQLRRLSRRLIDSQEDERRRVARELHDDVSQRLALLAIHLHELRTEAEAHHDAAAGRIAAASDRAQALAVDVHNIARELHPARLGTLGLPAALRALATEIAQRHRVDVAVGVSDWPDEVPDDVALTLYRVAQEALGNAARHSGGAPATVELEATRSAWSIGVSDEGRGFALDGASNGIGLASMRERARLAGGTIKVDSKPGHGTSVRVTLPREPGSASDSSGRVAGA